MNGKPAHGCRHAGHQWGEESFKNLLKFQVACKYRPRGRCQVWYQFCQFVSHLRCPSVPDAAEVTIAETRINTGRCAIVRKCVLRYQTD
jgi:hypothetical protein